jgi:hypothetical protein
MNHTIVAHVLGSKFVSERTMGREPLEGCSHETLVPYLCELLERAAKKQGLRQEQYKKIADLQEKLLQMLEITRVKAKIAALPTWQERAKLFSQWMCHRLSSLQEGESFTFSGGWSTHAMLYEVICMVPGSDYCFRVINTGLGTEYHPSIPDIFNTQHMQEICVSKINPETLFSEALWQFYFGIKIESESDKISNEISAQYTYNWLYTLIPDLQSDAMQNASLPNVSFRRGQRFGGCSWESLLYEVKLYLDLTMPKNFYQRLRSDMREEALRDYDAYLVSKGLLPEKESSPPYVFVDERIPATDINWEEQEIFKNLGVLDFLEQTANRLRLETLRNMRKKREEESEVIRMRTRYLELLQKRIEKRRNEYENALKNAQKILVQHRDPIVFWAKPPHSSIISSNDAYTSGITPDEPWDCVLSWPKPQELISTLKRVETAITRKDIPMDDEDAYVLLAWVFRTMPIASDPYWESICKNNEDAVEALTLLQKCSELFMKATGEGRIHVQADAHGFNMHKLLAIFLKLSEADPVMKDAHVDLDAVGLTAKDLSIPSFFTTDPSSDQAVSETQRFLKEYSRRASSKKVKLFSFLNTFSSSKEAGLEVAYAAMESNEVFKYLWDHMLPQSKECICMQLSSTYSKEPPSSLILATAMVGIPTSLSPGYAAIQQHLLNMLVLVHTSGAKKEKQECIPRLNIENLQEYGITKNFFLCFDVRIKRQQEVISLDQTIQVDGCGLFSKRMQKKAISENEILEDYNEKELLSLCQALQCQDDRGHQLLKMLLFYSRHRDLLTEDLEQFRLSSLLFEPGVLMQQLKTNPAFFSYLATFVKRGYEASCQQLQDHDIPLFFLHLSSQIETYAKRAGVSSDVITQAQLPAFFKELQIHWKLAEALSEREKSKLKYHIALEALAYCGREGAITDQNLSEILKYHFYCGRTRIRRKFDHIRVEKRMRRVAAEAYTGTFALASFISTKPSYLPSAVADALDLPPSAEPLSWELTKAPLIASSDGKYKIDLISGEVFFCGKKGTICLPIAWTAWLGKVFPNQNELHSFFVERNAGAMRTRVSFRNAAGTKFIVDRKQGLFKEKSDGSFLHYYDVTDNIPDGIRYAAAKNINAWYDPADGSIVLLDQEGNEIGSAHVQGKLIEKRTGYIAVKKDPNDFLYNRLKACDPNIQMWKNPKNLEGRIDLPSMGISLDINEKGEIEGRGSLTGFYLAQQQYVHSLIGFTHFLLFEHRITGEKRVVMPTISVDDNSRGDFHKPPAFNGYYDLSKKKFATFIIQEGEGELLYSDEVCDRFYLAYCYFAARKYEQAFFILETQAKKLAPYNGNEKKMLFSLLRTKDTTSLGSAIHLKVHALLLENENLGEFESANQKVQKDYEQVTMSIKKHLKENGRTIYENYLNEIRSIPEYMHVSKKENDLYVREIVYSPKEEHPKVSVKVDKVLALDSSFNFDRFIESEFCLKFGSSCLSMHPIDEHFFTNHPISMYEPCGNQGILSDFLSFYAIARSSGTDKLAEANRRSLSVWLACYHTSSCETCDMISFLKQVLLVPRSQVDLLPHPELLRDALNLPEALGLLSYTNLRATLASVSPPSSVSLPKNEKSPKNYYYSIHRLGHSFFPIHSDKSPFFNTLSAEQDSAFRLEEYAARFSKKSPQGVKKSLVSFTPLIDSPAESFYAQSFAEMQRSVALAAKEKAEREEWDISEEEISQVSQMLQQDIEMSAEVLSSAKNQLLAIANTLPRPTFKWNRKTLEFDQNRKLSLQSHQIQRITMKDLQLLYAIGNNQLYYEFNSRLLESQIRMLSDGTGEWLYVATEQQKNRRALKIAEEIQRTKDSIAKKILIQQLHAALFALRAYKIGDPSAPAMLTLEHQRNMRLRPSQVENFKKLKQGKNIICEIPMGSGKSDVLTPLLLHEMDKLTFLILPEELFATDVPKLQRYAKQLFNQDAICLNWKDTSQEGLKALAEEINRIKKQRGFIVVTAKELHDFYLADLELQRRCFSATDNFNKEHLNAFVKVKQLLLLDSKAIIDEVDMQLRCSFEVLKSLDKARPIDSVYRTLTQACFDILTTHKPITSKVYFEWSRERAPTAESYIKETHTSFLIEEMAKELLSSKTFLEAGIEFSLSDRDQIEAFLKAPEGSLIKLPDHLNERSKNALSYAKKQLHVILPSCIGKIYEQSYGLIPPKKNEEQSLLPVPWKGARAPQVNSQFACYDEYMALTYESYHKLGIPVQLLKNIITQCREKACLEIDASPLLTDMRHTVTYKEYATLLGPQLLKKYPNLGTLLPEDIADIAAGINQDPRKLNFFIGKYILPSILMFPAYIRSNGHSLVGLFGNVIGISGTVKKDQHTFHSRFEVHTDPTIVGRALVCLEQGPPPISLAPAASQEEQLVHLLNTVTPGSSPPLALIDAGALFKDIPPRRLATILLEFGKKQNPAITSVVYFDKNKRLILKEGNPKPELYSPTASDDPSRRFTYYDQLHCTGTDIKQDILAIAWMTINKETTLQQFVQAAWRMRGLEQNQFVKLVIPEEVTKIILNLRGWSMLILTQQEIFSYVKHVEISKQLEDNCKALFQQINMEFVRLCQELVYWTWETRNGDEPLTQKALWELDEIMISRYDEAYYDQYGKPRILENARDVLLNYVKQLEKQLENWIAKYTPADKLDFNPDIFKPEIDLFIGPMNKLIIAATAPEQCIISPTLPSRASLSQGMEVEIQQEKEQNQERDQNVTISRTGLSEKSKRVCNLPYVDWCRGHPLAEFAAWQKEGAFAPLEWDASKIKGQDADHLQEEIRQSRHNILASFDPKLPQNTKPFLTLTHALALSGKAAGDQSALNEELRELFSPQLHVSLNVACSNKDGIPFYGSQKYLEWALFIQDKHNPSHIQLLLLSRKEAEACRKILYKARMEESVDPSTLDYNIALISPRLHAMNYGDGFYEIGKSTIDKSALYSSPTTLDLTPFEQLLVQAKFAMGEPALYAVKEQHYLYTWLSKHPIKEVQKLFLEGFLPASQEPYQKSAMENVIECIKRKTPFSVELTSDAEAPAEDDLPPDNSHGLPLLGLTPRPKRIKLAYGTKLTNEEREQHRREHIQWLLENWKETNVQKREKVRKTLEQLQIVFLYDLVDNLLFVETLNKFAAD